ARASPNAARASPNAASAVARSAASAVTRSDTPPGAAGAAGAAAALGARGFRVRLGLSSAVLAAALARKASALSTSVVVGAEGAAGAYRVAAAPLVAGRGNR